MSTEQSQLMPNQTPAKTPKAPKGGEQQEAQNLALSLFREAKEQGLDITGLDVKELIAAQIERRERLKKEAEEKRAILLKDARLADSLWLRNAFTKGFIPGKNEAGEEIEMNITLGSVIERFDLILKNFEPGAFFKDVLALSKPKEKKEAGEKKEKDPNAVKLPRLPEPGSEEILAVKKLMFERKARGNELCTPRNLFDGGFSLMPHIRGISAEDAAIFANHPEETNQKMMRRTGIILSKLEDEGVLTSEGERGGKKYKAV